MHPNVPFGKTYIKTILREIRGSLSRFVAIFAIAALGVGFLAGLLATTPDMKHSMDRYFRKTTMMDIFIKATMGITDEDIAALEALDDTALVLPAYVMDSLVRTGLDEVLAARIYGLPLDAAGDEGFVNQVEILEGRFPEKDDECLVQQGGGYFGNFKIGDTFFLTPSVLADEQEIYRVNRYTVTGIVKSPLFISFEREPTGIGNGRLGTALYVRGSSFALPVYTDAYITLAGGWRFTAFSDPYQEFVDEALVKIEALGEERSRIRREDILMEAWDQGRIEIDRGTEEYEQARISARQELAAGRLELEAGTAELEQGEAELRDGEDRIAKGRVTLAEEQERVKKELADNEALLKKGEGEIAAGRRILAESKAALDAVRDEVEKTRASRSRMATARGREGVAQYDAGVKAWEEGERTIAEKERELRRGWVLLEQGRVRASGEFERAAAELDAAEAEIEAGWLELLEGRQKLGDGEAKYEAARARADRMLQQGEDDLLDAQRKIGGIAIDNPQWYVLDRNANVGCANYRANVEKIADLARVFPIFFLLVAALVVLTTMTRMVEEERIQIGVLKALGYQKRVIAAKYLIYCGITGILGSAAGMVSGFWGLPMIIYNAFGTRYRLPPIALEFNWPFGLIACGAVLLCTMGATVYASYSSLWEKPAALMRPRPPRAGKRIFLEYIPFIWKPMKFTYKVTARNLLRYKKHFFMTVTGIAGCTALMLAGFGLRDSLVYIARTQFASILKYDLRLELEKEGSEAGEELIHTYLPNTVPDGGYTELHITNAYVIHGDDRISVSLYIPGQAETLGDFIRLQGRNTNEQINFTAHSAVITEKMADIMGLAAGDPFILENADGRRGEFVLTGITENYVGNYLYLGTEAYRDVFGGSLSYDTLLVKTGLLEPSAQDAAISRILESDRVMGAEFTANMQTSYNNLLSSISLVVLILVAAAGSLAMIVLYNLTYININERSRELATLRVLGFHQGEAAAYIFREITILSIVGAALGLLLGIPLHRFIISVAETTDLMFGRKIAPLSFIFSGIITLGFSVLVDLLMLGKIRKIKMAESMKAVD
ncbi:ABC transporter permease [Treponema primitia]|uniref:ABC transporter permease n=1 Tax=Treponema primitia TaxID=88058 RepID=UPI0002554FB7|nr:ABC transporter permease [Treponema primitia]